MSNLIAHNTINAANADLTPTEYAAIIRAEIQKCRTAMANALAAAMNAGDALIAVRPKVEERGDPLDEVGCRKLKTDLRFDTGLPRPQWILISHARSPRNISIPPCLRRDRSGSSFGASNPQETRSSHETH
jgi:hypothetical protein